MTGGLSADVAHFADVMTEELSADVADFADLGSELWKFEPGTNFASFLSWLFICVICVICGRYFVSRFSLSEVK